MIVRCPECSTGFKLPADRVGPKGAKVRCTKCDHVFRVRVVNGDPEIFYKPGEEPAASAPAPSEAGNMTAFGGPHSFANDDAEESDPRETGGHTAIGRPGDLKNLRSTPRKPLASVETPAAAAPMAAGIINKRTIKRADEPEPEPEFSGPGMAHAVSEADDATSVGKPIEAAYSPKATSFGLPSVSSAPAPFGDNKPLAEEESDEIVDTSNTSFGFPVESEDAPPARGFGEVDDDEDDDLRATAFGRPAFQEEEGGSPSDEPQFGDSPKGTLFGLPAVSGGDDAPEAKASPSVEVEAGLDLFEDEVAAPEPEEFGDDPFAGAFEDNIDASPDLGVADDPDQNDPFDFGGGSDGAAPGQAEDSFADAFGAGNDFAPAGGGIEVDEMEDDDSSANFFTGGGGGSDFGDASELVDPAFGSDGPSFDPNAGEAVSDDDAGSAHGHGNISFGDEPAPQVDLVMETSPPPAAERERAGRGKKGKKAKKTPEKTAPAARSGQRTAVAAAHEGGPVQKVMNLLLIVMLVVSAFVGVVLYKTGGVIDFARFDHMLAIVIDGETFEPRPEWGMEMRTTDTVVPLKPTNVFAYPSERKDGQAFVVSGQIKNEGTSAFGSIKVRVSLVGPDGSILADQTVPGGTSVDTRKLKTLAVAELGDAVERQMSNVSPDAALPFVAVFEELPTNSVNELQVLVEVTEKSEIPNGEK